MIIKQLSVFVENKSGRLTEVADIIGKAGLNITAFSVADTSDFGILRLIVSDPDKGFKVLKENDFSATLTDIIAVYVPNIPGGLAKILKIINAEGINIEYMYAFSMEKKATVALRVEDVKKCIEILQKSKMELIKANDLYSI